MCQWKHKQYTSGSLSIFGHPLPTASSGHEVFLSSETQFLSHNLWYSLVSVHHWVGIQRRMPQFCVETFVHQLWGFGTSICCCLQCSFLIHLFVYNFLPNCTAIAWIISGQCKSAADNVRNHVGIPKVQSIANTSYNWSCQ